MSQRHFIRHPSDIPIECRMAPSESCRRHRLRNIGLGGLCFQTHDAFERGCVIRITIPVREPPFETTGIIVWRRRINGCYEVGVRFSDEDAVFSVRMVEQVCRIQHYRKEVLEKEGRTLTESEAAIEWVAKYARYFPS